MSDMEAWKGKAKIVSPQGNENLEALCKNICEEKNIEKSIYHASWVEALRDELYNQYVVINGILYDVSNKQKYDHNHHGEARRIDNDTVEFNLVFYNGGTCFSEMLECAINEVK